MTTSTTSSGGGPDGFEKAATVLADALEKARADTALEARTQRRRVWRWRIAALMAGLTAIVVALSHADTSRVGGPAIARYTLTGVIVDDPRRDALFKKIAENDKIKALILRIDSPGGTTVGGEALYASIRGVADKKPVVAVMGEVAASAAYIAAMGADHIVARGNTITASIGVIFTAPNFYNALQSIGVEVVEVKSGAQKAEPSPYKPVDDANIDSEEVLVADSFNWFLDLVRERRALDSATIGEIRDGRILTGRMALDRKMIDQLGGEAEAIAWLEAERDVARNLKVIDREVKEDPEGLLTTVLGKALGLSDAQSTFDRMFGAPRLMSTLR